MQLRDVIKKAVKNSDAKLAGQIAVKLRNKGLNYKDIHKFVNKVAPIDPRDWEALLQESGASIVKGSDPKTWPKPKFKLGDRVKDKDGSREGKVSFVGEYDDYKGQYSYKVTEKGGKRHYWNENSMIKAEKSNPAVVTDLKTMGILPPSESPADYPEIGKDPTWELLYEHPTVEAKRETIATLIKAGRTDLANVVAKMPVKGDLTEARPPDPHEAAMNAAVDAAFKALKKAFRVERNDIFDALDELTTGSER